MPKPREKDSKPEELKRLTDYVTIGAGERLEGERIDLQGVLGEELQLIDFVFIPSTKYAEEGKDKGEFVVIQYKRPGDDSLYTSSCGGVVVKQALKEMPKNYLPALIRITYQKSPTTGRRYLAVE